MGGPGNSVLPLSLGFATGDEEVSASQPKNCRSSSAFGAHEKAAPFSDRDERHHGLGDLPANFVSVPSDRVLAIPIQVQAHRVERHAIPGTQGEADLLEQSGTPEPRCQYAVSRGSRTIFSY